MKSLKRIIRKHFLTEQSETFDKFAKIQLLMLCDRLMDEIEIHRSKVDISEIREISRIFDSEFEEEWEQKRTPPKNQWVGQTANYL